jgi:hypothetical protein
MDKTTYVERTNLHRKMVTMPDPRQARHDMIVSTLKNNQDITPRQEAKLVEELGELTADLKRYPPEEGAS